mmetsp:Transcript_23511/g.58533  ORF Transcript_23511/g.58533 Transcript_23511/m.58533 type:complete len:358 (+) Transcript_23511:402-1475(+)
MWPRVPRGHRRDLRRPAPRDAGRRPRGAGGVAGEAVVLATCGFHVGGSALLLGGPRSQPTRPAPLGTLRWQPRDVFAFCAERAHRAPPFSCRLGNLLSRGRGCARHRTLAWATGELRTRLLRALPARGALGGRLWSWGCAHCPVAAGLGRARLSDGELRRALRGLCGTGKCCGVPSGMGARQLMQAHSALGSPGAALQGGLHDARFNLLPGRRSLPLLTGGLAPTASPRPRTGPPRRGVRLRRIACGPAARRGHYRSLGGCAAGFGHACRTHREWLGLLGHQRGGDDMQRRCDHRLVSGFYPRHRGRPIVSEARVGDNAPAAAGALAGCCLCCSGSWGAGAVLASTWFAGAAVPSGA